MTSIVIGPIPNVSKSSSSFSPIPSTRMAGRTLTLISSPRTTSRSKPLCKESAAQPTRNKLLLA